MITLAKSDIVNLLNEHNETAVEKWGESYRLSEASIQEAIEANIEFFDNLDDKIERISGRLEALLEDLDVGVRVEA